jgi:predicted phage-related endonuclease
MTTLTTEQLETRRKHLTASDAGAALNLDPYKSPSDLWAEKVLDCNEIDRSKNEAIALGNVLEPMLLDWCADEAGISIQRRQVWRVHDGGILACTLDGIADDGETIVEAKTTGLCVDDHWNPHIDDWGAPMTDEIPTARLPQIYVQQACFPTVKRTLVPAMIGGRGRVMFEVPRDDDAIAAVVNQLEVWWNQHVVPSVQPEAGAPSYETCKSFKRPADGPVIEVHPDDLQRYLESVERRKQAQKAENDYKAALMAECGDTYEGVTAAGVGTLRFRTENAGKRIDSKKLRHEFPDVYAEVAYDTTRVMPRFKDQW